MSEWDQFPVVQESKKTESSEWDQFPVVSEKPASQPGQPKTQKEKTWKDAAKRSLGLGARQVVTGLTGIPAMFGDAINSGANIVTRGINKVAGTNIPKLDMPSQIIQRKMTDLGVPEPETRIERILDAVGSSIIGQGGLIKAAETALPKVTSSLGKALVSSLAENPSSQLLSSVTGSLSGAVAKESGAGAGGQVAATLAGSLIPSVGKYALSSGTKRALRGSESNIEGIQERAQTFKDAGSSTPSAGQVTGRRFTQGLESFLSKVPGGAGVMSKAAEKQASEIGNKATKIADDLSTISTPSVAGRTIEKGISGEGGFVDRFRKSQSVLYGKLDQYIPKDQGVRFDNTKKTLSDLNADIPNAPALSEWFKNSKIQGIEEALKTDTKATPPTNSPILGANGKPIQIPGQPAKSTLPYESLKRLRTLVGYELEDGGLTSDVPRSMWKRLYGALSRDMENAATSTRNPDAIKAMKRANSFTAAGHKRIDDVLEKVVSKNIPEDIYKSATSSSDMQAGATKISSIMKSLQPAERDVVKSAFIRRMGNANPGAQDASGGVFSTQTFLTNWNKMSPQAKSVMFSGKDGKLFEDLEQIAKSASMIKDGSKVFANPSGSSPGAAQIGLIGGIAGSAASGNFGTAALLLTGAGSANLSARLMTNPKFVSWLAKETKYPKQSLPIALNSLSKKIENEDDSVKEDAEKYVESLLSSQRNNSNYTLKDAFGEKQQ